ncbi:MAG: hypothetical protein KKA07_06560 [Bacteroidetes bacterium]|nr:hypothetical protein [Bacteroidota bacterium]MBU1718718.1 hypothetical protein [Bacteroidota bacterium]
MKRLFRNSISIVLVVGIGLMTLSTSCKKKKPAPDLPPSSSMVMSFSNFASASDTVNKSGETYQNWGHSYANVVVWNVIITIGLAVPVASFLESFNHQAVWDNHDEEWSWTYNVWAGGASHTCRLVASMSGDYIQWKMFISKQNGFTDFMWYEGQSHSNGTNGYWTLYESPTVNQQLLQIDWNKNSDGTEDIKYTNIKPNGPENGGYIAYGITSATDFNAFYDIYNKGQDNLTEIDFNTTDRHGRVKDPRKFGDSDFHCWGTTLADEVCN